MASEIPDLEIVLPDGRPVSDFVEEQEDLSTAMEFDELPDGGLATVVEVDVSDQDNPFYSNLAEDIAKDDADVLAQLASSLSEDFEGDLNARKDWLQTYADGWSFSVLKLKTVLSRGLGPAEFITPYFRKPL